MSKSPQDVNIKPPEDVYKTLEKGTDLPTLEQKKQQALVTDQSDAQALKNPDKMPRAIYYIVPNEFAERFCYYGINPLLNNFFKEFLKLGKDRAGQLRHTVTVIAYATPLIGAALSDSLWGKYLTIILLSLVYVIGVIWTSVFSIPSSFIGNPPALWGPLVGLVLLSIGTGGIKPCVSSLGADQFHETQTGLLNAFYNYFYMSINLGSLVGNAITPVMAARNCYGSDGDCYASAFGLCAGVMALALIILWMGRSSYKIVPPTGTFVPLEIIKINWYAMKKYLKATKEQKQESSSFLEFAKEITSAEMLDETRDFNKMVFLLLPSPFFWMAFDQSSSTWMNLYDRMNKKWIGEFEISSEHTMLLNSIMIIALIPVFTHLVYPLIERIGKFRLLDRMIAGMGFAAIAFCITGWLQSRIEANPSALIYRNPLSTDELICNPEKASECVNGAWMILPYFIITCGEILFSVSGLNLTYQESGPKLKSFSASLWLLTVAIGNVLDVALFKLDTTLGPRNFLFLNAGLITAAMLVYFFVRSLYVYRADRKPIVVSPERTLSTKSSIESL